MMSVLISLRALLVILAEKLVYLVGLIEKMTDSSIMVKSINDICNILAHIDLRIPLSLQQLGSPVNKVGGKYLGEYTLGICLIDILKSVAEQTESCEDEDPLSTLFLKLICNIKDRVTG